MNLNWIKCLAFTSEEGIPFGLTVEGGVIWHDLRRTFATKLRARQVPEYEIADLLGHTNLKRHGYFSSIPLLGGTEFHSRCDRE